MGQAPWQTQARLGIAVRVFMPALVTAGVALLLSRKEAPPLAYIAGGLGTLIGADLTNLDKVRGLGAPVAYALHRNDAGLAAIYMQVNTCA
jgi:uncharacterized membrane protein